ncbi:MAG TPA: M20/M25/M40 family metallo-hydrolase [candidate division Zixibacteria bacterium]|nr:M20/M25/M40 family metallo-hydrolase [candidate division Zixibacteria bacterium]
MSKLLLRSALVLLLLALGVVAYRTARFQSKQLPPVAVANFSFESPAPLERLARALRHPTVSSPAPDERAAVALARFRDFLRAEFPRLHATLAREIFGGHSLLYTWAGSDPRLHAVLLAGHYDVVPAESSRGWRHPPFSGRIDGGYVWGRGALDDKAAVLAIMEAVEHLLARGFRPRRTIFLAFGHDEESGGANGAARIASALRARAVRLEYVLDEGGFITEGIVPGVTGPVALVGIAEKGYASFELRATAEGGHTAAPPKRTAIGVLSETIHRLDQAPFPARLSEPVRRLVEYLGPELHWPLRALLANLWLSAPLIERQLAGSAPTAALVRTTQAPTVFTAGSRDNVLPAEARAVVNFRILPGDTIAAVERHVAAAADPSVTISLLPGAAEPSAVSDPGARAFLWLQRAVGETAPGTVVAPALAVAMTDSRHYAPLAANVYRFLPITLTRQDVARFHGIDERVAARDYERCVAFFVRLILHSAA